MELKDLRSPARVRGEDVMYLVAEVFVLPKGVVCALIGWDDGLSGGTKHIYLPGKPIGDGPRWKVGDKTIVQIQDGDRYAGTINSWIRYRETDEGRRANRGAAWVSAVLYLGEYTPALRTYYAQVEKAENTPGFVFEIDGEALIPA